MKEVLVSTEELAKIVGISPPVLRTYLGNYRFSRFIFKTKLGDRYKIAIRLNKQCAYKLCDFFRLHEREEAIQNLEQYFEERENGNK